MYLNTVLEQYMDTMALRRGGKEGLGKALSSGATCTVEYSSGLQVSGKLVKVYEDNNEPVYLGFEGPATLSVGNHQLEGHGTAYHKDGFGSPVGKIKGISGEFETMSEGELSSNGIVTGNVILLEFDSGVKVDGRLEKITKHQGQNIIFCFINCTVRYKDIFLFRPEWGTYDMAVGSKIISAFAGPADPDAFGLKYPAPKEKTHHIKYPEKTLKLHALYNEVRTIRENKMNTDKLEDTWQVLKHKYPDDWLLPIEIMELISKDNRREGLSADIRAFLKTFSGKNEEMRTLIDEGLLLTTNP
jgi:phenylalanine-4-hydroxylase